MMCLYSRLLSISPLLKNIYLVLTAPSSFNTGGRGFTSCCSITPRTKRSALAFAALRQAVGFFPWWLKEDGLPSSHS